MVEDLARGSGKLPLAETTREDRVAVEKKTAPSKTEGAAPESEKSPLGKTTSGSPKTGLDSGLRALVDVAMEDGGDEADFFNEDGEFGGQDGLHAVGEGVFGLMVDFDEQAVGADGDGGAG